MKGWKGRRIIGGKGDQGREMKAMEGKRNETKGKERAWQGKKTKFILNNVQHQ